MKLAYYPGCTLKSNAKNFEDSAISSLKELGVELDELTKWNCCGTVFSLGDLSIFILSKDVFNTDKLTVNIYEKTKFKNEFIESKTIEVKSDEKKTITDIRLYKEGVYLIEVLGEDKKKIAEGVVSILDVY